MNLDEIPAEVLLARGKYATVRGAQEDSKKELSILCGGVSSTASQILRAMQPDNNSQPDMAAVLTWIEHCTKLLSKVEDCAHDIDNYDSQRRALKPLAWGK